MRRRRPRGAPPSFRGRSSACKECRETQRRAAPAARGCGGGAQATSAAFATVAPRRSRLQRRAGARAWYLAGTDTSVCSPVAVRYDDMRRPSGCAGPARRDSARKGLPERLALTLHARPRVAAGRDAARRTAAKAHAARVVRRLHGQARRSAGKRQRAGFHSRMQRAVARVDLLARLLQPLPLHAVYGGPRAAAAARAVRGQRRRGARRRKATPEPLRCRQPPRGAAAGAAQRAAHRGDTQRGKGALGVWR